MSRKRASVAGITLTEMLVALFITGMISVAGAALLMNAARSSNQLNAFAEQLQKMEVGQALIRNDMAAMIQYTYDPKDKFGVSDGLAWRPIQNSGPVISFYRNGWLSPQAIPVRSDLQAVEYRLDEGSFVRVVHLPFARAGTEIKREMFADVARVEARLFEKSRWITSVQNGLSDEVTWPDVVELNIVFKDNRNFRVAALTGARE